jgi:type I restriction enzyme S subunit
LITITGNSVGNVAWVDQDIGEAYISQHVGLVRLLNSSFAEYTCLFLSPHSPGNGQIVASQTGQSKPGLNLKNLQEFVVVMPSEPERSAIVSAWRDIDALVEELERLVAKKRDLKQAVMQQLLTGQTRLPGFTTEWRLKRLGDVAEIIMGQSPSSANYNMTGNGLPLIQGNADVKSRRAIKRIFTTQITKTGKRGDILMSVRAPVGAISLTEFDVCLGRGVCAIRFQNDFMYHFLINLENQWAKHSKGSTFDSVNSEDVRSLAVCMPIDSREQRAIAEVFNDIDCELYIRA